MLHMHMTYKRMLRGATRMALSCLTLLGAMLPVACVYEQIPEAYDEADTYIHLNLISSETNTRGVSDEHQGTVDENTITSLRVWAFDADSKSVGGTALCYKEETALNATTGLHTFTMKLPRMTGGRPLKKIDLDILANAESGSNLATPAENRQLTRQELQEKVVSESFGLNAQGDPQCVVVPAGGLPMSRIVQDIPIEGYVTEAPNVTNPTINIPLTRAVSKLHFFFSRRSNAGTEQVEVTGIEVGAGTVPEASLVFPLPVTFASPIPADLTDTRSYSSYVNHAVRRMGTIKASGIPELDEPKSLIRGTSEDAEAYMARLANAGMTSHYLTYLRETDQEVPITIHYRLGEGGSEKAATVNVLAGDLRRNHEVVVYGYFLEGGLLAVEPQVLPWAETSNFNFADKCEVKLTHGTVTLDATGNYIAISYQDWTTGAAISGSPLITFDVNTGARRWVLQTDNPAFGFLVEGETQLRDQLTGYDGTVNFYLMPRVKVDEALEQNRKASIFMTLPESDNSRLLINVGENSLPGGDDHIDFWQKS